MRVFWPATPPRYVPDHIWHNLKTDLATEADAQRERVAAGVLAVLYARSELRRRRLEITLEDRAKRRRTALENQQKRSE